MTHPRPPSLPLLLLAALCTACSGDKVGDTGTSGTVGYVPGPCGRFSSAQLTGAEWTWKLDPSYEAKHEIVGGWDTVALGAETYGEWDVWLVQETAEFVSSTWPEEGTQVERRWHCNEEGAHLVQIEGVYSRQNKVETQEGWWSAEYPEPPLMQPAEMAVGDSWVVDASYDYSRAGTSNARLGLDATFTVTGEEVVTTDAGTFDTFVVEVEWGGDPSSDFLEDSYTKYVAQEVGTVKVEGRSNLLQFEADPEFSVEQ